MIFFFNLSYLIYNCILLFFLVQLKFNQYCRQFQKTMSSFVIFLFSNFCSSICHFLCSASLGLVIFVFFQGLKLNFYLRQLFFNNPFIAIKSTQYCFCYTQYILVCYVFIFVLRYLNFFFLKIYSLIQCLINRILLNFHINVNFLILLICINNLILLLNEIIEIISTSLNLLILFCDIICDLSCIIFLVCFKKNVHSVTLMWNVLYTSVRSSWSIVLDKKFVPSLIFYVDVPFTVENLVLKSPVLIVLLCTSSNLYTQIL